jgi:hypothetical protein
MVGMVQRCIDADRFHPAGSSLVRAWAGEIWTMRHGLVTLALTGILPAGQPAAAANGIGGPARFGNFT